MSAAAGSRLRRVLREPLLQFLLVGAVLLLAQHFVAPAISGGEALSRQIELPPAQVDALRASYREVYGREPDAAALRGLAQRWIDDEVLYREALALGLDRGDPIVRRELQQKMRFLLEDTTPVAEPSEAELQQWLDQHREQYAHPAALSFEQVYVSREGSREGSRGDAAARAAELGAQLQKQPQAYRGLGDVMPGGQQWQAQTPDQISRNFGLAFTQAVKQLPLQQWSAPIASGLGLHLVRITARVPGRAATLAEVRERVRVDCRLARREAANRQALDALRKRYDVQTGPLS